MLRQAYAIVDAFDDDCGCAEALTPGTRVRLRYDACGNPWIVAADGTDGPDEVCCTCTEELPAAREARGPHFDPWHPYQGVYAGSGAPRSRYSAPAMRGCTE